MTISIKQIDDIWIRNSFVLGYWAFGSSDIDITISVHDLNNELGFKIASSHKRLSALFKIIGELCIISKTPYAFNMSIACINTYELFRDPRLRSLAPPRIPTLDEKIVFLHKFIFANWVHDQKGKVRQEKLDFVFKFIDLDVSTKTFQVLKNELGNLIKAPFDSAVDKIYDDIIAEKVSSIFICPSSYKVLLFNKLYSNGMNDLVLTELEIGILISLIKWEIWGAYTNRFFADFYNFNKHMGCLFLEAKPHLRCDQYFDLVGLAVSLDLLSSN